VAITYRSVQEYLSLHEIACRRNQFDQNIIEKVLRYGAPVGNRIEEHEELPRCMARLRELILIAEENQESLQIGTVVIAKKLGKSSGRFDRTWYAPQGGLWLALAWADVLLPEFNRLLPLAVGNACCEAIRAFGVDASIKWVNDVHIRGHKIAGVLSETIISPIFEERYHLVGIGINVNNNEFPDELAGLAASIQGSTGAIVDLQAFAVCLLAKLTWNLGLLHYQEEQVLDRGDDVCISSVDYPVLSSWRRLTDSIGRQVLYGFDVQQQPLYRATVKDLADNGGLVMELNNGQVITEHSGEINYLD
jgi:BirA family biotin operon repressor/biotin-[acetyl-CoA-carboxylase] ligase